MLSYITKTLGKLFGTKYDRDIKALLPAVEQAKKFAEEYRNLSNDDLRAKTIEFRARIATHLSGIDNDIATLRLQAAESTSTNKKEQLFVEVDGLLKERNRHLEDILRQIMPEAFGAVKEAARRLSENPVMRLRTTDHDRNLIEQGKDFVSYDPDDADFVLWQNTWSAAGTQVTWNMVHFDVQLIGGMVLHDGKIAEMATGEGKTLVATLPAYLNGLSGQGVHIVTVNDYLARRDAEWNGPLYQFMLLTCDCIDKYQPNTAARRQAYGCDIIYGTNNEFGFDYLRDNMVLTPDEMVQRKHHYAMVDEVDSVLVDDARTPLIISGPVPNDTDHEDYQAFKPIVERLYEEQRRLVTQFLSDARKKIPEGNSGYNEGEGGLSLFRAYRGLPKYRALIKFLSETGMKSILQKVEGNYMQEQSKNMHVADAPLFFTIEEKTNQVELTQQGFQYLAKVINDPNFFVMPDITAQMVRIQANSALSDDEKLIAKDQLLQDFGIKSRRLHVVQQMLKAYALFEKEVEYVVMDGEIKIVDESTGRILDGRRYSDGLHQAIEAKEAVQIKEATQTYATVTLQNYFRMYHKLAGMTGTAETEAAELWQIYKLEVVVIPTNRPISRDDKDDLVYKTERAKFNAVVEEIAKLQAAGRPVLVGTTSIDISEKLSRFLTMRGVKHNVLNAKQHAREAQIVAEAGIAGAVTIATNMAGRGTDIKLTPEVKAAGGLAIIGTERHDSRRVDRQLRGRAGRQGDPGSSQFFVSLEDSLMRKFGSDRLAGWMDKMGYKDDEVLQHSMVSNSIERAQKKVEENNFGVRKRLLEYDDVMNIQREAIYKKRQNALFGERLTVDVTNMFADLADEIVNLHKPTGDYDGFRVDTIQFFGVEPEITPAEFKENKNTHDLSVRFQRQVLKAYREKSAAIVRIVMPLIHHVYETQGHQYRNIAIPYSDGIRTMQVVANLEQSIQLEGKNIVTEIEKGITLSLIDAAWKEHLRNMDDLKDSVQSASFEQKDPLVIYKIEAYNLFKQLMGDINRDVTSFLSKGIIPIAQPEDVQEAPEDVFFDEQPPYTTNHSDVVFEELEQDVTQTPKIANEQQAQKSPLAKQQNPPSKQSPPPPPFRNELKIGRNDNCPCGSGKKYKNCHGK